MSGDRAKLPDIPISPPFADGEDCRPHPDGIGEEVSYGFMFPDVHPPKMANWTAGRLANAVFYPYGSVSLWFFEKQQEFSQQDNRKPIQVYVAGIGPGHPVKIGISCNPERRVSGLQTSHRQRVLKTIPNGSKKLEAELHRRFDGHRLHGEWFCWCEEIAAFISGEGCML